jgi:multidrug resistance efflux pump
MHSNLLQQKELNVQDLDLSQKTFDANQSLKDDKVISDLDYRNEKSKLINKKLSVPQINSAIISNESQQNEKQKEIMELENTIVQQKSIFSQSLNTLKSQTDDWKKKYLLTAPTNGKIAFASFLQENQQLQLNQIVCFINPGNSEYYAEVYIPQTNFGKVKRGQKVLLKFPSYPFQEYGSIKGNIDFISNIGTDSGYLAKVILPNGLNTSYKKQLQFREGLKAQVEIITADMSLLQRFYYNIIKQVNSHQQ